MSDFTGCIFIDARSAGSRLPRQLAVVAPLASTDATPFALRIIDDTGDPRLPRIAQHFGARLLGVSPAPLGQRINDAIARSSGEVLVFPSIGNATSAEALEQLATEVAKGRFDAALMPTLHRGSLQRLLAWIRRLPHGEGLCLSRTWFERIGGCDAALDDAALDELLERLHACGARVKPGGL
ncbi:hypothetical protein ACR80S_14855 [Halomonas sp. MA07-2]|uniref:hypothetical protein n=1 Tax=unclassified Halomonas TaxID=2609666 RepID=UPI003EEBD9DB